MEKRIASPRLTSDLVAKGLLDYLEEVCPKLGINDAIFYYDFPLFRDESEYLYRSKVLLATRTHGLIIICPLSDNTPIDEIKVEDELLTQLDSLLYGKFLRSQVLRANKRSLKFEISPVIYFPEENKQGKPANCENRIFESIKGLEELLLQQNNQVLTDHEWGELIALLEGTKAISKPEPRIVDQGGGASWAGIIKQLEDKIANFDRDQRNAAITVVDGPQRIRGIAGSGKTIVIAMKAAHLHLAYPEKNILVTFWTKSLYDLLKQQITRFYRQFSDRDPDWKHLDILHAWGGVNQEGVYYNTCIENGVKPMSLRDVPGAEKSKFNYACEQSLKKFTPSSKYDYILIDEGQDLPASFYQLCFAICGGSETDRNIVWAYDELQTIMDSTVQDVQKTFGFTESGEARMDLARAEEQLSKELLPHDVVLRKSYRNPPELLMVAHALGMGIYGENIVQVLENKEHWTDLGYEVEKGDCLVGEETVINRPAINSPLNLSESIPVSNMVRLNAGKDFSSELDWIVEEIEEFLAQGLKPEDILIISLDDRNASSYFSALAQRLDGKDLKFNNIHAKRMTVPKVFLEGHITFSTIYKAKGNEAPVVFVCGIDALGHYLNDIKARNRIFTAFTRSKGFLRVSGVGRFAEVIFKEISVALRNFPRLVFTYPDPETISMIQRDLTSKSQKIRETLEILRQDIGDDISDDELLSLVQSLKMKSE